MKKNGFKFKLKKKKKKDQWLISILKLGFAEGGFYDEHIFQELKRLFFLLSFVISFDRIISRREFSS